MSYRAVGSGTITLSDVKFKDDAECILAEVSMLDSDDGTPDSGELIYVFHDYRSYHEDEIYDALKKLSTMIVDGEIEFRGDEDEHWRFKFIDGSWYEQDTEFVYTDSIRKI